MCFRGARTEIQSEGDVYRFLGDDDERKDLLRRQEDYRAFEAGFLGEQDREYTEDTLGYVSKLEVGDLRIAIIGLNSSWLSEGGASDDGKLLIGESQAKSAIDIARAYGPHVVLGLQHHPFDLLQRFDRRPVQRRLEIACDFIHCGHLHDPEVTEVIAEGQRCITIKAGASFESRMFRNTFTTVEFDPLAGKVEVAFIQYNPQTSVYEYESRQDLVHEIDGTCHCTIEELAKAIDSYCADARTLSRYLASLLLGSTSDFPIVSNGGVVFGNSQLMEGVADPPFRAAAEHFGEVGRAVRLLHGRKPLTKILAAHGDPVRSFARCLNALSEESPKVKAYLTMQNEVRARQRPPGKSEPLRHTVDLLMDLISTDNPIRPALYFYDQEGQPMAAESVVDITGDLEIQEDGSLSVQTAMEPLGELTISTHGQGELVSGSAKVVSGGPIGGVLRFDLPDIGVAGVGASPPMRDALFPVRQQAGGIRTAAALHNLEEEAMEVSCRLMSGGVVLEEVEIPLEANGQMSWFVDQAFPAADTSDFVGSVHCTAVGVRQRLILGLSPAMFTGLAVEIDAVNRIFTALPLVPVDRGGGGREAALDFAHFANGDGTTSDLVFVNMKTQPSGPAPTPFHRAIPPIRPAIYFYDTEGAPVSAESVVDVTGDLEVMEDGGLTVLTEMEPLGVLTISTHGRGTLVSGSVKVVSDGPIGGMLRYDLPGIGEAGEGVSSPLRDALFPVRRQEAGINTGVAVHNLGEEAMEVACELMSAGVVLDDVSIPLEANGQSSWFINEVFTGADTSDFVGSVRCTAPGEGVFTGVAVELDAANRIFTTLPVVPVPERMSQE